MKKNNCPECNKVTDQATSIEGEYTPSEGDISLCIYCGAINQFDSNDNIIPLPDEILNSIKENEPDTYEIIMDAVIGIKSKSFNL